MKKATVLLLLAISAGLLCLAKDPDTGDESLAPIENRPVVPFKPLKEADKFHGVVMQLHDRRRVAEYKQAIADIADLGADSISLAFAAYQVSATSSHIRRQPSLVSHAELVDLIKCARSHRLRVMVVPIVLLCESPNGEWRGKIVPERPEGWWVDYRDYINFAGRAASEGGAELLCVGSELNRMEGRTERWRELIQFVRDRYPKLKLGYQATWDRYWKVAFWDALDYAMLCPFFVLSNNADQTPTVRELVRAWDDFDPGNGMIHHRGQLLTWQRTIGKPVIFDEVGYCSQPGAACRPWDYFAKPDTVSLSDQANCYKAFLRVWADEPALGGMMFFEWTLDPGGPTDSSFMPRDKPAEQLIRDYFRDRSTRGRGVPPLWPQGMKAPKDN